MFSSCFDLLQARGKMWRRSWQPHFGNQVRAVLECMNKGILIILFVSFPQSILRVFYYLCGDRNLWVLAFICISLYYFSIAYVTPLNGINGLMFSMKLFWLWIPKSIIIEYDFMVIPDGPSILNLVVKPQMLGHWVVDLGNIGIRVVNISWVLSAWFQMLNLHSAV